VETGSRLRRGPGRLAQSHGALGENAAALYLTKLGYSILARNFKARVGEVDIVARDGKITVFVEVKRREKADHGGAAEFVSASKIRKVVAAARLFAAKHGLSELPVRFDVVAIDGLSGHEQLRHHKGAFDAR